MMGWYDDGWGGELARHGPDDVLLGRPHRGRDLGCGALRRQRSGAAGTTATPTPRAILDHRLASGEIDAEQYAQLRRLLDGQSAGAGTIDDEGATLTADSLPGDADASGRSPMVEPMTVLVVDDEVALAGVVAGYLEREGFTVVQAHDGPTAVALARIDAPRS